MLLLFDTPSQEMIQVSAAPRMPDFPDTVKQIFIFNSDKDCRLRDFVALACIRTTVPAVEGESEVKAMAQYRILFVDDDVFNHWCTTSSLANAGFAVTSVCRGSEAVRLLRSSRNFDLLLTDFQLPDGMSGFDLAAEWRRTQFGCPVIYISTLPQTALGALQADEGFVSKRAEPSELLRMIDLMLLRSCVPTASRQMLSVH